MAPFNPVGIALDARRLTRAPAELLARRQQERLADLVAFARAYSRFYAAKYRHLPEIVTDPRQLPPVTKPELMAHFDEVVTDPAIRRADLEAYVANPANIGRPYMGQYMVWTTSGTTGVPGLFLQDRGWDAVLTAVNVARIGAEWYTPDVLWGMLKLGGMSASIFAGNGHFLGVTLLERQRHSNRSRAKRLNLVPVTLPIHDIVQRLNALRPAMLSGYASALGLLAQEQLEGRLDIHPAIVISSAEPLAPDDRARIRQAFGVPARNNYGCSEGGVMGYECRQQRMHLNADWVMYEPVDAQHRPVPDGVQSAHVLITNLANRVMPIIRYELGDRAIRASEPCGCGITLPVIDLEGRSDDILRFVASNGIVIPVLPLALWATLKETPSLARFQAIQTGPAELKIRLEAKHNGEDQGTWQATRQRAITFLHEHGLSNVAVVRAAEPPMRDPKSGKFRSVWVEHVREWAGLAAETV